MKIASKRDQASQDMKTSRMRILVEVTFEAYADVDIGIKLFPELTDENIVQEASAAGDAKNSDEKELTENHPGTFRS